MKKLKISLGGQEFYADMLPDKAPKACAAVEAVGAFESVVFAANVCSNEITWNTPIDDLDDLENPVFEEEPGNVIFYPVTGYICVFYGPTEPAGWCSLFAKLPPEEVVRFKLEADKVWLKQGGIISTQVVEMEV